MFAKMLFTTRAHAKPLTAFITSLVFLATALPALAQQQEQAAVHVIRVWHPFMIGSIIVGAIFVVLAIIGVMVIFVWWYAGQPAAIRFMSRALTIIPAANAPPSTYLMSALPGARSTRPSTKRNASYSADKAEAH